jgi:hypothetical protein
VPLAAAATVTASEAPGGGAAALALRILQEHAGAYTTTVGLVAPEARPTAEIYPMSVPNVRTADRSTATLPSQPPSLTLTYR